MAQPDTDRGIQNVKERVAVLDSRQTVGERYVRRFDIKNNSKNTYSQEDNEYLVAEEEEALLQEDREREARSIQKKRLVRKMIQKGLGKTASKTTLRFSIGIVLITYPWQFMLAVVSLVGFGIHIGVLALREQTFFGKVVGFFIEFQDYLPFEHLGYAAWGVNIILTIGIFFGYLFFFYRIGINPFATSVLFVITAVCFFLNLAPVTNIFPWLVIWVFVVIGKDFLSSKDG